MARLSAPGAVDRRRYARSGEDGGEPPEQPGRPRASSTPSASRRLAGRDFTAGDDVRDAPKVAIVNEAFARFFFDGPRTRSAAASAVGASEGSGIEIVGLVKDVKVNNLRDEVPRHVLRPARPAGPRLDGSFYVRTRLPEAGGDPARVAPGHAAPRRADPGLRTLQTMEAQIGESLFAERMVALLSAALAAATLLAAVGLYGVMSYSVARAHARDRHPPGARRAPRERVLGMVLREVGHARRLGRSAWACRSPLALARLAARAALRPAAARPADARVRDAAAGGGHRARGPRARAAGDARRPDARAAVRVGGAAWTRSPRTCASPHGCSSRTPASPPSSS